MLLTSGLELASGAASFVVPIDWLCPPLINSCTSPVFWLQAPDLLVPCFHSRIVTLSFQNTADLMSLMNLLLNSDDLCHMRLVFSSMLFVIMLIGCDHNFGCAKQKWMFFCLFLLVSELQCALLDCFGIFIALWLFVRVSVGVLQSLGGANNAWMCGVCSAVVEILNLFLQMLALGQLSKHAFVWLSHGVPHWMCEFPFSKHVCIFTNLQILIRPTFNMQNAQHFCAAPSSMKLHNKQIWLSCCWKTHTVVILGIRRAWCLVCMFIGEGVVTCNIAGNHWLSASVSSDTRLSKLFEMSICSSTDFVFLKTIELTVKLPLLTTLH